MAETTGIAWTDHTANIWQGCTKVGPGCDGCYAAARDTRFYGGAHWGAGAPRLPRFENFERDVLRWDRKAAAEGRRQRVFINTLSDFFDNEVPQAWRNFGFDVMQECRWLDFQLLTKRIGNVPNMVPVAWMNTTIRLWPRNIWLGATMVNQDEVDRDAPKLRAIPAWTRFVSYEPAVGPVDWCEALGIWWNQTTQEWVREARAFDWLIIGGESAQVGHPARPFELAWARAAIRQCYIAGVPVFVKQLGSHPWGEPADDLRPMNRAGDDPGQWPPTLRIREFPA